ncbi:MAG: primosomal protein N' [Gammaproteobacteria bacterium]|nr:primosomal protein N' [Gammaproteobacteria bacterium]MYF01810.1 primosomal protein N' [Gammaproteobacteria bacterium]
MTHVIKVVIPRPVWQAYDYLLPDSLSSVDVGARVRVPFGRSVAVAVVVEVATRSEHTGQLKSVETVLDRQCMFTPDLLRLAYWLASYYHCPIGTVIETMLPTEVLRARPLIVEPDFEWMAVAQEQEVEFKRAKRQQEVWELLTKHSAMPDAAIRKWGAVRSVLNTMENKGLIRRVPILPKYKFKERGIKPTQEQETAITNIVAELDNFGVHVLDGVTGSGKTEVYIRVIKEVLEQGKQVLVLVPEIALTPQTANHFRDRFGSVAVLHSMRTNLQRFEVWCRVASGEQRLVLGTRSAIFTPFKDLGLIVVDEEHDASYKQADSLRYSARDAAIVRAHDLNIPVILGSATLSLETVENINRKKYRRYHLSARPGVAKLPKFQLLDIRGQILQGGMCHSLIEIMRHHLDRNGQVLVLINRRGFAPSLICHDCGRRVTCQDCDVRLTLHEYPRRELRCHYCDRRYEIPDSCPDCQSTRLVPIGTATQRVVETLSEAFPDVPVRRIDRDAVNTNRKLEQTIAAMQHPSRCILVGTQMLAKGHHLPNVTLVAVLRADAGFFSADFRAAERTAQLIVQVAGRAGRAEREGEVWIQTYDPEHPHLESLAKSGYAGFVKTELISRKSAHWPPYSHLALLRAEGINSDEVSAFLEQLLTQVQFTSTETLGPISASIPRLSNRWRCQAALVDSNRKRLHESLAKIARVPMQRSKIRWSIDVDPIDMS